MPLITCDTFCAFAASSKHRYYTTYNDSYHKFLTRLVPADIVVDRVPKVPYLYMFLTSTLSASTVLLWYNMETTFSYKVTIIDDGSMSMATEQVNHNSCTSFTCIVALLTVISFAGTIWNKAYPVYPVWNALQKSLYGLDPPFFLDKEHFIT
jgi:hypothetical protein